MQRKQKRKYFYEQLAWANVKLYYLALKVRTWVALTLIIYRTL